MIDIRQQELDELYINSVMEVLTEEDKMKNSPVDIDATDMRQIERRKRILEVMISKTCMSELKHILEAQLKRTLFEIKIKLSGSLKSKENDWKFLLSTPNVYKKSGTPHLRKITKDATMNGTEKQVVLFRTINKGIVQRGFQHNATVYKTPDVKNPFDAVTDQDIVQYIKEVQRKHKEPYVVKIEIKTLPAPSYPEVVRIDDILVDRKWFSLVRNETRLEVARISTIRKYKTPDIIDIESRNFSYPQTKEHKVVFPKFKKPKPYVITKRKFFFEFYARSVLQRIEKFSKDKTYDFNNSKVQSRNWKVEKKFVRSIGKEFSADGIEISARNQKNDSRKRICIIDKPLQNSMICSQNKFPRLTVPVIVKLEQLKSPTLVNAFMNTQIENNLKVEKSIATSDDFPDHQYLPKSLSGTYIIKKSDKIPNKLKISSSSDQKTTRHSSEIVTVTERIMNSKKSSEKSETDVSKNLQDTVHSDEKIEATEFNNTALDTIEEVSERSSLDENRSSLSSKTSRTKSHENSKEGENHLLNDSFGSIEGYFKQDLNDSQPWRFSSPIPKNNQLDDSLTEVINSMNENLTPSKIHVPLKLRETEDSKKYNLDSTQMSMIYSLTVTEDFEEDVVKESSHCHRVDWQSCLNVKTTNNLAFDQESKSNDELEYFMDEFVATKDENVVKDNYIDFNETIDLFDNSINIKTLSEPESSTNSAENDRFSTEDFADGSDLLEIPHSIFIQLQESNDQTFHQDIATSANEIIASIRECDRIVETQQSIVQEITEDVQFLNLDTKANETHDPIDDFKSMIDKKISLVQVANEAIEKKSFVTDDSNDSLVLENCSEICEQFIHGSNETEGSAMDRRDEKQVEVSVCDPQEEKKNFKKAENSKKSSEETISSSRVVNFSSKISPNHVEDSLNHEISQPIAFGENYITNLVYENDKFYDELSSEIQFREYEDTTLCQIVNKLNLTDLVHIESSASVDDLNDSTDFICSIKTLYM